MTHRTGDGRTRPQHSYRTGRAPGRVVLVGGGPGAEDLLTLRAQRHLTRATVVVVDRLAPRGALRHVGPHAEVVDVGKTPYHHPVPQHEINRLLVERARRGDYVVRLKGGDPYVFGRGGEELAHCRAAGVDCEVVPGVTSAFAAPAAADIPVTHRGVSTGVLLLSGHDELHPDQLAAWPHTIVVLMGMGRLRELCAALVAAGRDPGTRVAVVQQAWTPTECTVRGDLTDIADRVAAQGISNPATIVVGPVVDAVPVSA